MISLVTRSYPDAATPPLCNLYDVSVQFSEVAYHKLDQIIQEGFDTAIAEMYSSLEFKYILNIKENEKIYKERLEYLEKVINEVTGIGIWEAQIEVFNIGLFSLRKLLNDDGSSNKINKLFFYFRIVNLENR